MDRRRFLVSATYFLASPALVRASSLDAIPRAWSDMGWYRWEFFEHSNGCWDSEAVTTPPGYKPAGKHWRPVRIPH